MLDGVSLTLGGDPGENVVQFDEPRSLEVPYLVSAPSDLALTNVELVFEQPTCSRPAGVDADAWFSLTGGDVTCTYAGPPGFPLVLQHCSKSLNAFDALIVTGVRATTHDTLDPDRRFSITVPGVGGGILEEPISATETVRLLNQFSWSETKTVPEWNPEGQPSLWYGVVYVEKKKEVEYLGDLLMFSSLKPFFMEEMERWSGLRGFFKHQGDGRGVFAFTVLTGAVYTLLRAEGLSEKSLFKAL